MLCEGLHKAESLLMEEAREAQLLDGIGLSLHGSCGEIVGMGVASSSGKTDLNRDTMCLVYAMCSQFHVLYREKHARFAPPLIALSAREKEVLTWAAEGKSKGCIATILSLSEDTVKTYMQRIFVKLGVNSMQLAVVKAIALGLIHPNIPHAFQPRSECPPSGRHYKRIVSGHKCALKGMPIFIKVSSIQGAYQDERTRDIHRKYA